MKNLLLQIKREMKIFPFVLAVTLALFIGLVVILTGIVKHLSSGEENQRFKIALSGNIDEQPYINTGLTILRTLDDTRYTMEIVQMEENEAQKALAKGTISAYVVLPDDFMDKVLHGENETVKYITSPGGGGVVTLFKNEITQIITDVVVCSQKGTYGIEEAAIDVGLGRKAGKFINKISRAYVELLFNRSETYTIQELGSGFGVSMVESMACGILILLLMLVGLPYVITHCKKNNEFSRLLVSRGFSIPQQMVNEYIAHFIVMILLAFCVLGITCIGVAITDVVELYEVFALAELLIPIIVLVAAFNIMIFEISSDIVSGVLLHFFVSVSMCYLSGCMYPITAFPKFIQKAVAFTPTGMARDWLISNFTDEIPILCFAGVIVYAILFWGIAVLTRIRKIKYARG